MITDEDIRRIENYTFGWSKDGTYPKAEVELFYEYGIKRICDQMGWDSSDNIDRKRAHQYHRFWCQGFDAKTDFGKGKEKYLGSYGFEYWESEYGNHLSDYMLEGFDIEYLGHTSEGGKTLYEHIRNTELGARRKGWNKDDPFYIAILPEDFEDKGGTLWLETSAYHLRRQKDSFYSDYFSQNKPFRGLITDYGWSGSIPEMLTHRNLWNKRGKTPYTPPIAMVPSMTRRRADNAVVEIGNELEESYAYYLNDKDNVYRKKTRYRDTGPTDIRYTITDNDRGFFGAVFQEVMTQQMFPNMKEGEHKLFRFVSPTYENHYFGNVLFDKDTLDSGNHKLIDKVRDLYFPNMSEAQALDGGVRFMRYSNKIYQNYHEMITTESWGNHIFNMRKGFIALNPWLFRITENDIGWDARQYRK